MILNVVVNLPGQRTAWASAISMVMLAKAVFFLVSLAPEGNSIRIMASRSLVMPLDCNLSVPFKYEPLPLTAVYSLPMMGQLTRPPIIFLFTAKPMEVQTNGFEWTKFMVPVIKNEHIV